MVKAIKSCNQTLTWSSSSWRGLVPLSPLKWAPLLPAWAHGWALCRRPVEEGGSKHVQHLWLQHGRLRHPITVKVSLRKSSKTHKYEDLSPTELKPLREGLVFVCVSIHIYYICFLLYSLSRISNLFRCSATHQFARENLQTCMPHVLKTSLCSLKEQKTDPVCVGLQRGPSFLSPDEL